MDKLHVITENITEHDDTLFARCGKLNTSLNCLRNFNNEKGHYIKPGVKKDVLHIVEDSDRVMAKYRRHIKLTQGPQHLKQEKRKEQRKNRGEEEVRSL